MKNLKLKIHSWFYRRTGIMTNYSKACEYEEVTRIIKENHYSKNLLLDISMGIGMWQVQNGFYVSAKKVLRKLR